MQKITIFLQFFIVYSLFRVDVVSFTYHIIS